MSIGTEVDDGAFAPTRSGSVALVLACLDLTSGLQWLFVGIAVVNVLSATQDVVTDGLAVRLLDARDRGVGNGIQLGAYRIGMIVGGGVLLWLFSFAGWRALFVAMAVLIIASTIPVLLLRTQLDRADVRPAESTTTVRLAGTWWVRLRRPGVLAFICLIAAYKFGISMGSALVGPFLSDLGLSLGQIALLEGGVASGAALAGAALGAWYATRFGRRRALLVAGITQTLALGFYVAAALDFGGLALVVIASVSEHVFGGAATVVLFALMMDASERVYAATDYTLLGCAVVFSQGIAGVAAGVVGQTFGYAAMFGTGLVLSGLGCALLLWALKRGIGPVQLVESGVVAPDRT